MPRDTRDRITVDLRGAGQRVHASAAVRGISVAAFARQALLAAIDQVPEAALAWEETQGSIDLNTTKVTLRMPAVHALLLTRRARSAEVSQGRYVAELIEGSPPPPWLDRREAIAALNCSTDQLATLGTDLGALARVLKTGAAAPLASHGTTINALLAALRAHLDQACRFLSELKPPTSSRIRNGAARGKP